MHFRILKMIATSGFLAALECTKFVFGRGRTSDPLGEVTALPKPPSWFRGPISKGKERGEGEKKRGEERERKGKGGERKEREGPAPLHKFLDSPLRADST